MTGRHYVNDAFITFLSNTCAMVILRDIINDTRSKDKLGLGMLSHPVQTFVECLSDEIRGLETP